MIEKSLNKTREDRKSGLLMSTIQHTRRREKTASGRLVLLFSLALISLTAAASYTIRCRDGALLLIGQVETLKRIKAEVTDLKDTRLKAVAAFAQKFSGLKEISLFYDPHYLFLPTPKPQKEKLTVAQLRKRFRLFEDNPFAWFKILHQAGYQLFFKGNLPFSVFLESGGKLAGDIGSIVLSGKDVSKNLRGLNVAIVDGKTGKVKSVDAFDTYALPSETSRFQHSLQEMKTGDYLFLVARDEASRQFNRSAYHTLASLFGAKKDLTERKHFSYLLAGKKGAQEPIVEKLSNARLQVFLPADRPLPETLFSGIVYFEGFGQTDEAWVVE